MLSNETALYVFRCSEDIFQVYWRCFSGVLKMSSGVLRKQWIYDGLHLDWYVSALKILENVTDTFPSNLEDGKVNYLCVSRL